MAHFPKRTVTLYQHETDLYQYAIGALGRKMRTVAELKRLMRSHTQKDESGEKLIEAVIVRLKEKKYLNDADYTERYALSRKQNAKLGKRRIELDLKNKGVHSEIIHPILESVYENMDEKEQIQAFINRKHIQKPETQKETARIYRALNRAGFSARSIFAVLNHWQDSPTQHE